MARVEDVVAAGVAPEQLVLDPGLGFAKNAEHNWALLAGLDRLVGLGLPGAGRRLAARRSSAGCSPTPTAPPARRAAGRRDRWPPPCWPRRPAPGGCACTTPAPRCDAVRTVEAVRAARQERPWLSRDRRPTASRCAALRAHAHHGVYDFEREHGQSSSSTPSWSSTPRAAAAGDDLDDTVNYAELAQQLVAVLTGEPVNLLETLAQRLADVCLADPLVDAVEITVHKPQADLGVPFDDVTVDDPPGAAVTRAVLSLGANLGDRPAPCAPR